MAIKTYVPRLIQLVRVICVFITRYDTQLRRHIPTNALPAYEVLKGACAGFLTAIGDLPINP